MEEKPSRQVLWNTSSSMQCLALVVRLSPNWVRASCTDQCFIKNGIKWFSSRCGRVGQLILLDDVLALVLLPSISNYALVLDIGEGGGTIY